LRMKATIKMIWTRAKAAIAVGTLLALASCGTASTPPDPNTTQLLTKLPWGMTLNTAGTRLYVANELAYTVDVYDTSDMTLLDSIPTLCYPRQLTLNADESKLFVSHKGLTSCYYSQTSYSPRSGIWVSVIDLNKRKVTTEISIGEGTGPTTISYDPSAKVFYLVVTAAGIQKVAVLGEEAETLLGFISYFTYVASGGDLPANNKKPFRVVVDPNRKYPEDSNSNMAYVLDYSNRYIYPFSTSNPAAEEYNFPQFTLQTAGYCARTESAHKLPNGCVCTQGTDCYSGSCEKETQGYLYFCKAAECSANCDAKSAINVNSVGGYCDPVTEHCRTAGQLGVSFRSCVNPWDILPLSDNTLYVSCYGSSADEKELQPVYRILVDEKGLSVTGKSIIALEGSFQECRRPTELAADPQERYVFVACYYDEVVLAVDPYDGDVLESIQLPGPPASLAVSDDYIFVTIPTKNQIFRYPIASLPASVGITRTLRKP